MSDESAYEDLNDAEPEDSWDVDDDVREQLANLIRRAILLRRRVAFLVLLRALSEIVELAREDQLTDRELLRADDLATDVVIVRGRI